MTPARALEIIRARGAPLVLRRRRAAYNPETSSVPGGDRSEWNSAAIDWKASRSGDDGLQQKDTTRLLVAAEGLTVPKVGDDAEYAGQKLKVESSDAIREAGIPVCYDMTFTKA